MPLIKRIKLNVRDRAALVGMHTPCGHCVYRGFIIIRQKKNIGLVRLCLEKIFEERGYNVRNDCRAT